VGLCLRGPTCPRPCCRQPLPPSPTRPPIPSPPPARFDVYVCTTADRQYALEAWRLLDEGHQIIPAAMLARRLMCVRASSRNPVKSLQNVILHAQGDELVPVGGELGRRGLPRGGGLAGRAPAVARPCTPAPPRRPPHTPSRAPPPPPAPPGATDPVREQPLVQMAAVFDDREDVWSPQSRAALIKAVPYQPVYLAAVRTVLAAADDRRRRGQEPSAAVAEVQAGLRAELAESEGDLRRVATTLWELRQNLYLDINTVGGARGGGGRRWEGRRWKGRGWGWA
jgi:hypothetical protein